MCTWSSTSAGITVLPARSTRAAPGGGGSSPRRPTPTNRSLATMKAEFSMTPPSPVRSRAPSNRVTVGAWARVALGAISKASNAATSARYELQRGRGMWVSCKMVSSLPVFGEGRVGFFLHAAVRAAPHPTSLSLGHPPRRRGGIRASLLQHVACLGGGHQRLFIGRQQEARGGGLAGGELDGGDVAGVAAIALLERGAR